MGTNLLNDCYALILSMQTELNNLNTMQQNI